MQDSHFIIWDRWLFPCMPCVYRWVCSFLNRYFPLELNVYMIYQGLDALTFGKITWKDGTHPNTNLFQELIDKLNKGELSKDEYPCMNDPSPTFHGTSQSTPMHQAPAPHSMRSRRTSTWARPRNSDDGYSRYCCSFMHGHLNILWLAEKINHQIQLLLLSLLN